MKTGYLIAWCFAAAVAGGCGGENPVSAPGLDYTGAIDPVELVQPRLEPSLFGSAMATDGTTLAVGMTAISSEVGPDGREFFLESGIQLFRRFGGQWVEDLYLNHPSGVFRQNFDTNGDWIQTSGIAIHDDVVMSIDVEGITVFERTGGVWLYGGTIEPEHEVFFRGAATFGKTIAVLAWDRAANNEEGATTSGSTLRIYERDEAGWTVTQTVSIEPYRLSFGRSLYPVSMSDSLIAADVIGSFADGERVFGDMVVFERDASGQWATVAAPPFDGATGFGSAVSVDAQRVAVAGGSHVDIFDRVDGGWTRSGRATPTNSEQVGVLSEFPGNGLCLRGDKLLLGALWEDAESSGVNNFVELTERQRLTVESGYQVIDNWGAAYLFELDGGAWTQRFYIKRVSDLRRRTFANAVALGTDWVSIAHSRANADKGLIETWTLTE